MVCLIPCPTGGNTITNEITNQQTFSLSLSVRGKASARQV